MGRLAKILIVVVLFGLYWHFAPQFFHAYRLYCDIFLYGAMTFSILWLLFSSSSSANTNGDFRESPEETGKCKAMPLVETVVQQRSAKGPPQKKCDLLKKTQRRAVANHENLKTTSRHESLNLMESMLKKERIASKNIAQQETEPLVENVIQWQLGDSGVGASEKPHHSAKVQKCNFSTQEIANMSKAKNELQRAPFIDLKQTTQQLLQQPSTTPVSLEFKLIEELDVILPSIEGTFLDFMKAVEKFSNALSDYLTEVEEKKIADLWEEHQYSDLVEFLQAKATRQPCPQINSLKNSIEEKRLQYGCFLVGNEAQTFTVDQYNIKLYKEISCLLQDVFVRYGNELNKLRCCSLDELLTCVSWETIEQWSFKKTLSDIGASVLDILVEDFLQSLKPLKRQFFTEYRLFRMVLRRADAREPIEVGKIVWKIIRAIQNTYESIKNNITVGGQEEIFAMIESTKVPSFNFKNIIPRPQMAKLSDDDHKEKQLRETIFDVADFLGWFPQDLSLLKEEERELLEYFDRLLYSRRTRMAIVRDSENTAEGKVFADNLAQVFQRLEQADQILQKVEKRLGTLIGYEIKIIVPRQAEDYFPICGTVENIVREPLENTNLIKLEVLEKNHLRSFVVFTGNNIVFPEEC